MKNGKHIMRRFLRHTLFNFLYKRKPPIALR